MESRIRIDDQPIEASFFRQGHWLTEYITPDALEVKSLYKQLTANKILPQEKINACHRWVSQQIRYKPFISGRLSIEGKNSVQRDLWMMPSLTKNVGVGNCANKAFLLTSLLRNDLSPSDVHCVLGNLYNGKAGGHAWVEVKMNGRNYISESTRPDVPALVLASVADRYEPVHYFNDKECYAVEGRTVMEPFTAVPMYSTWLKDYLDFAYIEGKKR